jgi:hypothetical protein
MEEWNGKESDDWTKHGNGMDGRRAITTKQNNNNNKKNKHKNARCANDLL